MSEVFGLNISNLEISPDGDKLTVEATFSNNKETQSITVPTDKNSWLKFKNVCLEDELYER